MELVTFKFNPDLMESFLRFPFELYRDDPGWIPPSKREIRRRLSPDFTFYQNPHNDHLHLLALHKQKVLARVSAFANHALKSDGEPVGTLGFFESTENTTAAKEVFRRACRWLKETHGIHRVWGPINFDIWHGYRCMTRGFARSPFPGEPYNMPYYPSLFEDSGFTVRKKWHSFAVPMDRDMKFLFRGSKIAYDYCLKQGYKFIPFKKRKFNSELKKLHSLISDSYAKFTGYTGISPDEFQRTYSELRWVIRPKLFSFINDPTGVPVGFSGVIPDVGSTLRWLRRPIEFSRIKLCQKTKVHSKSPIVFLIGLVRKEQLSRNNLGKALSYHVASSLLEMGYSSYKGALIAEDTALHTQLKVQAYKDYSEYVIYEKCI